jgi:hypothetical protein
MKYLFEVNSQNGVTNFCTLEDAPVMKQMGVDVSTWIEIETEIFNEQNKYKIADNQLILLLADEYDIYFPEVALSQNKRNRLLDLEADFNASKKITLKNGTTWVIEGATYKALKNKLTLIFSDSADLTKVYTFFEGDISKPNYYVNVICYIWRYILNDFYESILGVGNNRKVYDFAKADILNAQDLNTLNAITWSFTPAKVIDVSEKASELEKQSDTPQYVLDVIAAAKDAQGEIHLVQTA